LLFSTYADVRNDFHADLPFLQIGLGDPAPIYKAHQHDSRVFSMV
jgi:hypothetical protein